MGHAPTRRKCVCHFVVHESSAANRGQMTSPPINDNGGDYALYLAAAAARLNQRCCSWLAFETQS